MDVRQITPELAVAPQITKDEVALAASMGFRTLISNRPDEETDAGEDSAAMAQAAAEAGMAFHYLPYYPGNLTIELARAFEDVYESAEKPILAYCRSGTRSSHLWALSQAGLRPVEEIIKLAADAGYDHSSMAAMIANYGAKR